MSDYESSYYEIALTHRQVVISFVALLLFVLTIFLCGVWVGKNAAPAPDQGPTVADASPAAGDEATEDLSAVEEYSFDREGDEALDKPDLSVLDQPGPAADGSPADQPQTTLAQELGREPQPARTAPPAADPETDDAVGDVETGDGEATAETGPPPLTSKDGPFRPASVTPAPSPTPPGAEPSGSFVVQVFSGRDEDQAKKVVQTLVSDGYAAYLSPVKVGSQMRYRVRIGPYEDRGDAEGTERIVRQKYRYETWVTTADN